MNNETIATILITIAAVVVVQVVVLLLLAGGSTARLGLGVRALFRALSDSAFGTKVRPLLDEAAPTTAPAKPSGVPVRVLAILQREGRLIDFLMDKVAGYSDEQVGHFAKDMHAKCSKALTQHLTLVPVRSEPEDSTVEVPAGFDPSAVRLTGNVTGEPPFRGTLKHAGWRVTQMNVPAPPAGQDEFVLMPAEVELP